MPGEDAPEHRHTQNAFRFVVEGEGVWTVVERRPGPDAPRRLPAPGRLELARPPQRGHRADGLDRRAGHPVPVRRSRRSSSTSAARRSAPRSGSRPDRSRSERLWGHPGLVPVSQLRRTAGSPLLCYRWEHTDQALADQLELERAGYPATVEPGHAVVRYTNPTTGGDVLPTIRAQFHRITRGTETAPVRETGSSVYQVFDGSGQVTVGDYRWSVGRGDLFVVPSWQPLSIRSEADGDDSDSGALDLFQFSDAPIFEKLNLYRVQIGDDS